jgi:hypothetical protein
MIVYVDRGAVTVLHLHPSRCLYIEFSPSLSLPSINHLNLHLLPPRVLLRLTHCLSNSVPLLNPTVVTVYVPRIAGFSSTIPPDNAGHKRFHDQAIEIVRTRLELCGGEKLLKLVDSIICDL